MTGSGPPFEPSSGDGAEELLPQPRAARRGRIWLALAAVAVLAAGVGFAVTRPHRGTHPQARPDATPSASHHSPPPSDITDPVVVYPAKPLPDLGRFQLFARAAGAVVEINFAAGGIVATPVPALSTNSVGFFATPGGVLIQPSDAGGYYVPDYAPAQRATGALATYGLLPGPASGEFWAPRYRGTKLTTVRLLTIGADTTQTLRIPADVTPLWGPPTSDGSGYLLLTAGRGVFDLRPDGAHRLPMSATDAVLAAGTDRLLVTSCSPSRIQSCPVSLIGLPDGARTRLGSLPVTASLPAGTISSNTALIYQEPGPGRLEVRLLDLRTGRFRGLPVAVDPDTEPGSAVFSPDGRWAFVVSVDGTLTALDARTGSAQRISADLPRLYQLALRG